MIGQQLFLLHGVTGAPDAPRVLAQLRDSGLGAIGVISDGDLAGLVSTHDGDLTASLSENGMLADPERAAQLALLHHRVLAAAVNVADIVPVCIGSVFSSAESARCLIAGERSRFVPQLYRLKGTIEMGLRVAIPEREKSEEPAQMSGRTYLRQRAAGRSEASAHRVALTETCRTLLEDLSMMALDAVQRQARRRSGESAVLADTAFLIKRELLDVFVADVRAREAAVREFGAVVNVTGPWPAYSFIADEQEAASWATH